MKFGAWKKKLSRPQSLEKKRTVRASRASSDSSEDYEDVSYHHVVPDVQHRLAAASVQDVPHRDGSQRDESSIRLAAKCFRAVDSEGVGEVSVKSLRRHITESGISLTDKRIMDGMKILKNYRSSGKSKIKFDDFNEMYMTNPVFFYKIFTKRLVIPDFQTFCSDIDAIYNEIKDDKGGSVASYIPQLANVDPEQFAISICTVDGQMYSVGDFETEFSLQSASKPFNYCIALDEHGADKVHQHVGREPSGRVFNEIVLNEQGLPHNPMINAGAMMCCALVRNEREGADRFAHVLSTYKSLMGGKRAGFNNSMYLSERKTASRNFALAYFMQETGAFPKGTNLMDVVEFYFQCCSVEVTADTMSVAAATLAASGICPITNEKVFKQDTVKNCLSLMYSCGMYDFSGEFAFKYGIPAKSGVSGVVMGVIPNTMGIVVWSPRLDKHGNSVRGVRVFEELTKRFNFHMYDFIDEKDGGPSYQKRDPRLKVQRSKYEHVFSLCNAAATGDVDEVKYLWSIGVDLNASDYDKRTALHLAASDGCLDVIRFLVEKKVELDPEDRWGNTPLDEAAHGHQSDAYELLKGYGAQHKPSRREKQKQRLQKEIERKKKNQANNLEANGSSTKDIMSLVSSESLVSNNGHSPQLLGSGRALERKSHSIAKKRTSHVKENSKMSLVAENPLYKER